MKSLNTAVQDLAPQRDKILVSAENKLQARSSINSEFLEPNNEPSSFKAVPKVVPLAVSWRRAAYWSRRSSRSRSVFKLHEIDKRATPIGDILAKVETLAYRLELLEQLSRVHFHVSNLKKCFVDEPLAIPLEEIQIDDKLNFIEEPVKIMDREVKRLKQSRIPIVKVRWNSRRGPEFTWEREDQMKKKYPHLFVNP
ncbi:hypothetical protein Tco_0592410 [Tanacetum coccineum]